MTTHCEALQTLVTMLLKGDDCGKCRTPFRKVNKAHEPQECVSLHCMAAGMTAQAFSICLMKPCTVVHSAEPGLRCRHMVIPVRNAELGLHSLAEKQQPLAQLSNQGALLGKSHAASQEDSCQLQCHASKTHVHFCMLTYK